MSKDKFDITHSDWKTKELADARQMKSWGGVGMVAGPLLGMVSCASGGGLEAFGGLSLIGIVGGAVMRIAGSIKENSLK